jgi:hypothetical protein
MKKVILIVLLFVSTFGLAGCPWFHVKEHVNSPPPGSRYFPTFDEEGLKGLGLNFFR